MIKEQIEKLFDRLENQEEALDTFETFKVLLNTGQIRAAEYNEGKWIVNEWVKKGILLGFRLGKLESMHDKEWGFIDKHTYGVRKFSASDAIRIVPGGSTVRDTAYIGKNVTIMPPSFINAGAYVDDGTMIDSHALVGSCAQVGKNVHLSAGSMLGGVLEPINASPVIVEDDVFIGGNCGIYEGVIVKKSAVIAAGVVLTGSIPLYDSTKGIFVPRVKFQPLIIPPNSVVIPGSRSLKNNPKINVYCPVIIKYRDDKTDEAVKLEDLLR
ncbi:MAG: 2,3,4,5-tetrahydropyridine-2,6-dicarboxylate N-succinyltransferase [Candidatus Cloacimonetes bacterium]|nr:2,3,4,5-tetrahydropyridine-2,6-dicarboxylate N-succinyltransferase [Candidatus Cloacimonadota bacterium]